MHLVVPITITYSNDGSSMSGVGSYVVQSLTLNGVQRCLPTFGIFTESHESLKDLEICTLRILSASCCHEYPEKEILQHIKFVMTDSTLHNLNVINQVAEELGAESVPFTLPCKVHPLMMFQGKIKKFCQQIHDSLGNQKINECFLVDIEFKNQSFIIKSLNCLLNFINRDNSSKPWNSCGHFEAFIKPKKNKLLCLKDHRFNRLAESAMATLYHIDDIAAYLEEYKHIINGITILDCSFVEMEVLKPIYRAISMLGIHILKPFHELLIHPETNYTISLKSFPKLYSESTSIEPEKLFKIDHVFKFVTEEMFKDCLPDNDLLHVLSQCCEKYPQEIQQLITLCLKKFADGFAHQKGAIFGFSDKSCRDTGSVLKISDLDKEELNVLNTVQVHNLGKEHNVELFNYEISIRGKKNFEAASQKLLLNKSNDLIFDLKLIHHTKR